MRLFVLILTTGCSFRAELPASDPPGVDASVSDPTPATCDANGDGLCDDQTWRCGQPPTGPSENPLFGSWPNEALWAHDASIAGKGRFVVAAGGKPLALTFRYDWVVDCPPGGSSCRAQVEYGLVGTSATQRFGCLADKMLGDRDVDWAQQGQAMIAVPATPGIYDVRLEIAKAPACDGAWQTPGDSHTIAKICVP